MVTYYLSASAAFVALAATGILLYKFANKKLNIVFKIISVAMAALYIYRYCSGRDNINGILNMQLQNGFETKSQLRFGLFQVWSMFAGELLIFMYPFFEKKIKHLEPLVGVTFVFFAINFGGLTNHLLAIEGIEAANGAVTARGVMIAIETGLCMAYSGLILARWIIDLVSEKRAHVITEPQQQVAQSGVSIIAAREAKRKKALCWVMPTLGVIGIIIATMPNYAPQLLLNPGNFGMKVEKINFYHRLYIYPIAIIPITLYLLLKDKSYATRKFTLLYYGLAILNGFILTHKFLDYQGMGWVTALPLHLCNTALFITPLCITFKWKKLFYFTYFINVLGALLAITMPNYSMTGLNGTLFVSWTISFYFDHYQAFFMPLLAVALGIFPRPRFKEFKYSMIGFAIYYVLMLILNGWFTNYNSGVDYFFINSDFIADKLGTWAEKLRDITWSFKIKDLDFTYYPVYQLLFFLVYVAMAFAVWFIYELAYNVIIGWQDIADRNKKIKIDKIALDIQLAGRSIEEPMNMENENKLILKNFTKRYGKSDVYAVKDANLEVCGGQIYGFLGPNGAGKSTIIKSIVGIQTITDGAIEVCGYDVATQSVQAKRQIGFVPDHYALYERLTAREYINYIADLYEVSQEDRDERLNRFIELFEFQTAIDNPIKTYSHGMKQKVTIMSALIHNPKVWILDEPLTGLDPNSIFQVKECMKQHAQEGNIVFFSSHIIDVVERICDKIAIIRKGQIQCVRDVHEMEANGESLEQFYMQTINGSEVDPVAVSEDVKAQDSLVKTKNKLWKFGKKSKVAKQQKEVAQVSQEQPQAVSNDEDQSRE